MRIQKQKETVPNVIEDSTIIPNSLSLVSTHHFGLFYSCCYHWTHQAFLFVVMYVINLQVKITMAPVRQVTERVCFQMQKADVI